MNFFDRENCILNTHTLLYSTLWMRAGTSFLMKGKLWSRPIVNLLRKIHICVLKYANEKCAVFLSSVYAQLSGLLVGIVRDETTTNSIWSKHARERCDRLELSCWRSIWVVLRCARVYRYIINGKIIHILSNMNARDE